MTRRIERLPPPVANQIAAGEVVTRPASVVKELVDNALDAGARRIRVEIEGGGAERMVVTDDGSGMGRDDALLSLERHATSKIREAEDLTHLQSLGFRGEALPSIASVSRMTLRTRPADEEAGTQIVVEGGATPSDAPCGCAAGTTVEVADLFFNVPARRKFLRAASTESAQVGHVLRATALAHPEVHFELVRDGRLARRYRPSVDRGARTTEVLEGYELSRCEGDRGPMRIEAHLSGPERARSGAGGLYLFVAGRPVQDRALARAVAAAYGDALEPGRYPVGAVFIELPGDLVDVNVHPQKSEVRFAHARAVSDALHGVVASGLGALASEGSHAQPAAGWRRSSDRDEPWQWRGGERPASGPSETPADTGSASPSCADPASGPSEAPADTGSASPSRADPEDRGFANGDAPARAGAAEPDGAPERRWRVVGRAGRALLVCEAPQGLVVIHRRRARRAILLARAHGELEEGRLVAQRLLFPIVRAVGEAAADLAETERAARWGCEVRRVGPGSIAFHAVPRLFAGAAHEPLVTALLDALGGEPDLERLADLAAADSEDDERLLGALLEGDLVDRVGKTIGWHELGGDG